MSKRFIKKIAIAVTALLALPVLALASPNTLWEFYGGDMPSISERKEIAKEAQIDDYRGSFDQNVRLLGYLLKNAGNKTVGANIPVSVGNFYLSRPLSTSDTTIYLTSVNDLRGNIIDLTSTTKVYLTIEPNNTDNTEIVVCPTSGFSTTTKTFSSCTRGLAFSGSSEASVINNRKPHPSGAKIVMSNAGQFYNNFVDKLNPESDSTYVPTTDYNLTTKKWVENRNGYWEGAVADYASLPTGSQDGEARATLDDSKLYIWASSTQSWILAGSGGGAGTIYRDDFIATSSQTVFSLTSGSFPDKKYLTVYLNGSLMEEGASEDYVASGGNTITFNYGLYAGDKITMRVESIDFYNADWLNVNSDILPVADNTYDIGSTTKKFKDGYFGTIITSTTTSDSYTGNGIIDADSVLATSTGDIYKLLKLNSEGLVRMKNIKHNIIASSNIKLDAGSGPSGLTNSSPVKLREIKYNNKDGIVRVHFGLTASISGGGYTVSGRIYKNGSAYGTSRSFNTTSATSGSWSEDLAFETGDLIQLYAWSDIPSGLSNFSVSGFYIAYDINIIPDIEDEITL